MKQVDFDALADSTNIGDVLLDLGLNVLGYTGDSLKIECPNPEHVDRNPSCFFDPINMIYHCFGCHTSGNIINIVEIYKDCTRDEAIDYLNKLIGLDIDSIVENIKERFEIKDMPNFQLSTHYRRDWDNADVDILEFVRRRKFNIILFDAYGIGYNSRLKSITLPIIFERKIINIGERFIDPNAETKIKYKADSPLSKCVWGVFDGYSKIDPFFTEGIFDALRMREAGYNAYALLSNQLSDAKLRFLNEHFKGTFTIVPDNDQGGTAMIEAWKKQIHNSDVMIAEVTEYKDVDEMDTNKIHSMVRTRKSLIGTLFKNRIVRDEICDGIGERYEDSKSQRS